MGGSPGTAPGLDAFAAALLVTLLATSLPRLLRPLDDLRPVPPAVAFVSPIDRPG
jgi:hypothetical protein